MAVLVKDKYEKNVSPEFKCYKKELNKTKNRFLKLVFFIFFMFMIITVYLLVYEIYIKLNLVILFILIIFLRSLDKDIKEIDGLRSYQEFIDSNQDNDLKEKGDIGEYKFIEYIMCNLKNDDYKILNNIYLPGSEDWAQQIDSIIISPAGSLYIIEIKNWSGLISGQLEENYWYTHSGYRGNPYQQNERHLLNLKRAIKTLLEDEIRAYNFLINMETNAYLNICKYDKDAKNIYNNPEDLLTDILKIEKQYQFTDKEKQEKIITAIFKVHYNTLKEYEEKINKELLQKYELLKEDETHDINPQPDY